MSNTQANTDDRADQTPQTPKHFIGIRFSPQERRILHDLGYIPTLSGCFMRTFANIAEWIYIRHDGYCYAYSDINLVLNCTMMGIKPDYTRTIHETFWGAVELTKHDTFPD